MKQKLFISIFLLTIGIYPSVVHAQSMAIRMFDGTEQTIGISSLENVTFSTSKLTVNQISGNTESYNLSSIRKIYFKEVTTVIDDKNLSGGQGTFSFYPNPVENFIYLKNVINSKTIVKIYRMDGRIMLQSLVSSGNNSIDASNLPAGFYIISVNNQISKFIKL